MAAEDEKKIGQEYGEVRHAIDEGKLNKYIDDNVPEIKTPVQIKQFKYGQSNPTYFLTDTTGTRFVLRKKPPGDLMSPTAHAVEREFRVISALGQHNAKLPGGISHKDAVPVPKAYCLCNDEDIVGTPFYIMEFVQGRIFADSRMITLPKEERRECWLSAIRTLAALHRLDPEAVGLGTYGKKKEFYNRQLRTFAGISAIQGSVVDEETDKPVGPIPHTDTFVEWFKKNLPKDQNSIVHGDFKIDNFIYHPKEPRIIAVLDWELSTLGHPLSDLANLCQPFSLDCEHPDTVNDPDEYKRALERGEMQMLLGGLSDDINPLPSKETLLKAYCEAFGREYPIPNWSFCESFMWFRSAVISQGIAARVAQKQASSAEAKLYASKFPLCADAVMRIIDASEKETATKSKL